MSAENKTSPIAILSAWLAVLIPAGWGVYNTVHTAIKLFERPTIH